LDPDDPPVTQARALTRVEPGLPITSLVCLNDPFDETLIVKSSQQQGALPRLEREASAFPRGLVVHGIHLLMSDIFDRDWSSDTTENAA